MPGEFIKRLFFKLKDFIFLVFSYFIYTTTYLFISNKKTIKKQYLDYWCIDNNR